MRWGRVGNVVIMPIHYDKAPDVKKRVEEIVQSLHFSHIDTTAVYCFRSTGSRSKRVIARIHGLGRIWQTALKITPIYLIEVLSERYDKLSADEKDKILIHELLHIPHKFSGGFRVHKGYIDQQIVDHFFKKLNHSSS